MSNYYIGFTSDHDPRSVAKHHGILGQKWGVQNGPPYPLDASDHSASEKRAGWRGSLLNKTTVSERAQEKSINKAKDKLVKELSRDQHYFSEERLKHYAQNEYVKSVLNNPDIKQKIDDFKKDFPIEDEYAKLSPVKEAKYVIAAADYAYENHPWANHDDPEEKDRYRWAYLFDDLNQGSGLDVSWTWYAVEKLGTNVEKYATNRWNTSQEIRKDISEKLDGDGLFGRNKSDVASLLNEYYDRYVFYTPDLSGKGDREDVAKLAKDGVKLKSDAEVDIICNDLDPTAWANTKRLHM